MLTEKRPAAHGLVGQLQRITLTRGRGGRENAHESGISTSQNGYTFS